MFNLRTRNLVRVKKKEEPEGVTGPTPTPFFKAKLTSGAGF
jgi:hypothetical protein